ncbi:hypothetical protein [Streptomyces virginiae]
MTADRHRPDGVSKPSGPPVEFQCGILVRGVGIPPDREREQVRPHRDG